MGPVSIERIDTRIKWGLVITGILTLGFLAAAALRENVWAEWRVVRKEYAALLREKATDERGRALAGQFQVEIAQAVIPALSTVDRCVTCHAGIDDPRMADAKQPFRTHPGVYVKNHPVEQFGCTVCHRGQGRALAFEEAKAEGHHWDYPLLPVELTQASCGVCHTAEEVADKGGARLAAGKVLFEAKGCQACHKLGGRGGNLGPALDNEGLKVRGMLPMAGVQGPRTLPQWLIEHFRDPQGVVAGSQMKPPQLSEEEITQLTTYMLSLQVRDLPQTYLSPAKHLEIYKKTHPDPLSGEELYNRYCAACHDLGRHGRYDKFFNQFMPAVRGVSFIQLASNEFIEQTIRQGRPGTLMPSWGEAAGGLSDAEIQRIREYLQSTPTAPNEQISPEVIQAAQINALPVAGDSARGKAVFTRHCAGCHLNGLAPIVFNPALLKNAPDGFIYATIAYGRRNTPMPGFLGPDQGGFRPQDIADAVMYLRSVGGGNVGAPGQAVSVK